MKYFGLLIILLHAHINWAKATNYIEIEGKIIDQVTKNPIPYAKIYNQSIGRGTLSNLEGYFRLPISSFKDVIVISFMGFKKKVLVLQEDKVFYAIYLEEEDRILSEVIVAPSNLDYYYDLVSKCRKNQSNKHKIAKAYYELKSYHDTTQIELVEGFYNLHIKGNDVERLDLKAGRLALQAYEDRYFASLESSRAITQLKTFERNFYFPISPLEVKKKDLKAAFNLKLLGKYQDDKKDSIYHLQFSPKNDFGLFYRGELWIDKMHETVQKIKIICDSCQKYPFLPIFPSDSIQNVAFNITKTFTEIEGEMYFDHIDFFYEIDYKSRVGKAHEQHYKIATNAVLHAYNFEEEFEMINATALADNVSDYRKYNATPYNSFFWNYNDEFSVKSRANSNEAFFKSPKSYTNISVFKTLPNQKTGLFEHPFVQWSEKRILFREIIHDTTTHKLSNVIYENYRLKVDFYLDLNTYEDSTDVLTAVIFNPIESFYYLPITKETQCFINIYFDLCEIVRRQLHEELLKAPLTSSNVSYTYKAYQAQMEKEMNTFFKAVDRGTNRINLEKYNAYVLDRLGIDNIALFRIN